MTTPLGSRQEVEAVLAISRRLGAVVERVVASFFDEETTEDERYEAIAWARGQPAFDPEIEEHLRNFTTAQLLLAKARERRYA